MTLTRNIFSAFSLMMMLFFGNAANAADPIYTGTFSNTAIGGYDTTTYYSGEEPIKGSKEFSTEYKGANWLFASAENLATFQANPEKYAPQYGGYCAWAIAHDNLVKGDPKVYHIDNGKLYLNYNKTVAERWLPRKQELIEDANGKYDTLIEAK